MNGESLKITLDQFEKLKSVFPEIITEGKIDWEKLQATLGRENADFNNERYVLNWAGKSEAFKVLQQSTTATLKPDKDESINFETTENVFIEGENLEVLKVLQKAYYGKVKVIEIDPPYNTGNDSFIYPDSFKESREEYQKRIGERDEEGYLMKEGYFRKNSKDSGHYHSNWLSMMYPRLFLAKNLLRDDGIIFVHIDDNEVHNLRMIMNEIFGEENFVAQIVWRKSDNQANIGSIARVKEYIISFSKNQYVKLNKIKLSERAIKEYRYKDEKGKFRRDILLHKTRGRHIYDIKTQSGKVLNGPWMIKEIDFRELEKNNGIYWTKGGDEQPYGKIYLNESEGQISNDLLGIEFGTNQEGSLEVEALFDKRYFDFPKPVSLVQHFINIGSNNSDIILDFFAGSATTAQAILEQNQEDGGNRKFILVQIPEICDKESEAYKAGYKTIADISKERIRRVIQKIEKEKTEKPELFEKGELDLGFKVFKLSSSNFKIWRGSEITEDNLETQLDAFTNPVKEGSEIENMLYELILKSGYLLTDKVEKNAKYYSIKDGELIIALEEITQKLIDKIISAKPKKVITLDKLFTGNDQLKTNTVLQMKDAEIDFKTI
jgi:adenine-specific DNA-methyltransferase